LLLVISVKTISSTDTSHIKKLEYKKLWVCYCQTSKIAQVAHSQRDFAGMNSLGYFKDYGWLIIFFSITIYMILYHHLSKEYGEKNDEWRFSQTFY
jgi:hypothetical protein